MFRRRRVDANPTRPLRSQHRRSQSYAVIPPKAPDSDALGKKSKNQWRDFCLKSVADGYAGWRIRLIDKFADTSRNQIWFRRFRHVGFDCVPSFGELCLISRPKLVAFRHGIVDQNVEMTCIRKCSVECLLNGTRIPQVEARGMQSRHLENSFQIA